EYVMYGQTAGTDVNNMKQAAEQKARAPGSALHYSPNASTAEQPVWSLAELQDRANNEQIWHEGTIIQATVTVQGWIRPGTGRLGRTGEDVRFRSPMTTLNDMVLKIQTVTYTQDRNSGTLTTLDLVAPWLLRDRGSWNVGNPAAPQIPQDFPPEAISPAAGQ